MSGAVNSPSRTHYNSTIAVLAYQGGDLSFYGQLMLAPFRQRRHHHSLDQPAHQVARFRCGFAVAEVEGLSEVAHHRECVASRTSTDFIVSEKTGRF